MTNALVRFWQKLVIEHKPIVPIVGMIAVAVVAGVVLSWQLGLLRAKRQWVITGGQQAGAYALIGKRLSASLTQEMGPYEQFSVVSSSGSEENMERLKEGRAHFAFVQGDTVPAPNARLIASLYDEYLHLLVSEDVSFGGIDTLSTLSRVSLGVKGSGTRRVAERLLGELAVDLNAAPVEVGVGELASAFAEGRLDAAFVFTAPGSRLIGEVLNAGKVRLVSLEPRLSSGGVCDAFVLQNPAFGSVVIPTRVYGMHPEAPVRTVAAPAMLVAAASLEDQIVWKVTKHLLEKREQLARTLSGRSRLTELVEPDKAPMPYHPGAELYYLRKKPSFIVRYAETLSLAFTVSLALWSLFRLGLRWLADSRKERIDTYLREIGAVAELPPEERLDKLHAIRARAFQDLMDERLAANTSFVIFQQYIYREMQALQTHSDAAQLAPPSQSLPKT